MPGMKLPDYAELFEYIMTRCQRRLGEYYRVFTPLSTTRPARTFRHHRFDHARFVQLTQPGGRQAKDLTQHFVGILPNAGAV